LGRQWERRRGSLISGAIFEYDVSALSG
jgi:hypothetical protein